MTSVNSKRMWEISHQWQGTSWHNVLELPSPSSVSLPRPLASRNIIPSTSVWFSLRVKMSGALTLFWLMSTGFLIFLKPSLGYSALSVFNANYPMDQTVPMTLTVSQNIHSRSLLQLDYRMQSLICSIALALHSGNAVFTTSVSLHYGSYLHIS